MRVRYESWERESTKTLEPYGLVLKGGHWYLIAASTRKNRRTGTYRVDHIRDIETLDETFSRPDDFDLAKYWTESVSHVSGSHANRDRRAEALRQRFGPLPENDE